jgi:hypothetical protein
MIPSAHVDQHVDFNMLDIGLDPNNEEHLALVKTPRSALIAMILKGQASNNTPPALNSPKQATEPILVELGTV